LATLSVASASFADLTFYCDETGCYAFVGGVFVQVSTPPPNPGSGLTYYCDETGCYASVGGMFVPVDGTTFYCDETGCYVFVNDVYVLVSGPPVAPPTPTPVPQGGACATPAECATGFCVDGVCCNAACNDAFGRCDLPGQRGTCAGIAPAPMLAPRAIAVAAALLIGVAGFALRRRTVKR